MLSLHRLRCPPMTYDAQRRPKRGRAAPERVGGVCYNRTVMIDDKRPDGDATSPAQAPTAPLEGGILPRAAALVDDTEAGTAIPTLTVAASEIDVEPPLGRAADDAGDAFDTWRASHATVVAANGTVTAGAYSSQAEPVAAAIEEPAATSLTIGSREGIGARPLSLRPRADSDGPERGDQLFVDAWDAHAVLTTPKDLSRERRRSTALFAKELVETGILALTIFILVRGVIQNFRVEGSSMDPTYATGQYVLVNKLLYTRIDFGPLTNVLPFLNEGKHNLIHPPQRGDVIVFHPPLPNSDDRDFIKRVIGLPGDTVKVQNGKVSVNGQELGEPYLRNTQTFCGGQWCDLTLGPDQYFVMGDNRTNSSDSRLWGPIRREAIIGKSWWIYLPRADFGPAPNQRPELGPAPAGARAP